MSENEYLVCVPVIEFEQAKLTPLPSSKRVKCSECQQEVWVSGTSPKGKIVICIDCMQTKKAEAMLSGGTITYHGPTCEQIKEIEEADNI